MSDKSLLSPQPKGTESPLLQPFAEITQQVLEAGGTVQMEGAAEISRPERLLNNAPAVGGLAVGAVIGIANAASRMLPEGTPMQSVAEAITNFTSVPGVAPGASAFAAATAGFGISRRLWKTAAKAPRQGRPR